MTDIRPWAVAAAARGFHVFPTRPGGKEQREGLTWPKAATSSTRRLELANWRPGENYGIATKASGLAVIDLDRTKPGRELPEDWRDEPGIRDGWDVLATLAGRAGVTEWPATYTVKTPSGGAHLYYLAPEGRHIPNRSPGPLIDVKAAGGRDGGYVLGPGSVLDGRAYEVADDQDPQPLPGWLADAIDPPAQPAAVRPVASITAPVFRGSGLVPPQYAGNALRDELRRVLDAQEGERNNTLNRAAFSLGQLAYGGLLDLNEVHKMLAEAAAHIGLTPREAAKTIGSGVRAAASSPRSGAL